MLSRCQGFAVKRKLPCVLRSTSEDAEIGRSNTFLEHSLYVPEHSCNSLLGSTMFLLSLEFR